MVSTVRSWLSAHPVAGDVFTVLSALVVTAAPYFDELRNELDADQPVAAIVLVILSCLCLALRRRVPWAVWGVTSALGLFAVALTQSPNPGYVPAAFALYTLTSRVRSRWVGWAAGLSVVVPPMLIIGLGPLGLGDDRAYDTAWWTGLAAVSGIAVRGQREVVEAANERARQAEAASEEEAGRRVTEERLRIARELHDVVAHHVAVIDIQAGVARQLLRSDPDGATQALGHVRDSSRTVLNEVPGMLGLLRTSEDTLERAPVPRLQDAGDLVEQARRSGLQVVWKTSGTPTPLAPSTDLTAYRVVQEGLTNAGKYGTGEVLLRVAYDQGGLTIELRNAQAAPGTDRPSSRHGLTGMRERVASAGGTLTAGPEGPGTWTVRVWLPVDVALAGPPMVST